MAKVRRFAEYLDGQVAGCIITAGDEERARRNGYKRGSWEFNLQAFWYAAKRGGLPYTDGEGDEGMLAWLDHVSKWDLYFTQAEVDEIVANEPAPVTYAWQDALEELERARADYDGKPSDKYLELQAFIRGLVPDSPASALQQYVRDDLPEV